MKRSNDYYLKRLSFYVEAARMGDKVDLRTLDKEMLSGLKEVFNQYLLSLWMSIGDTSFNRDGYRETTDYLLEQLKSND